jgi:glutathione S-transferase
MLVFSSFLETNNMALKLCGFAGSNYHNKVKLQLLEKGVAFEEELVWTGLKDNPALSTRSPLGKIPFLDTPQGVILESSVCSEYIEATYPSHPLIPKDPFAAAKVRELVVYLDLHMELVARELFPQAYFGAPPATEEKVERIRKLLKKGIAGFASLAKFSPYVAGDTFTLADCAAIVHLPTIAGVGKLVLKEDLFAELPTRDYLKAMSERPTVVQLNADRKVNTELMMAKMRTK